MFLIFAIRILFGHFLWTV